MIDRKERTWNAAVKVVWLVQVQCSEAQALDERNYAANHDNLLLLSTKVDTIFRQRDRITFMFSGYPGHAHLTFWTKVIPIFGSRDCRSEMWSVHHACSRCGKRTPIRAVHKSWHLWLVTLVIIFRWFEHAPDSNRFQFRMCNLRMISGFLY